MSNFPLNESPSEKEGKCGICNGVRLNLAPSMKVPPKRKGNEKPKMGFSPHLLSLNESPSEKEGK